MEEVLCPYCNEYTEIKPDEHYKDYEEYECRKCHKNFEVFAEAIIEYSVCDKADCLNGGDHKWKRIAGYPEIRFRGMYRCEDCSAEHIVKEELTTNEEWDRYFEF